ncbi:MAG: VOC family protein [Rhodospirillaceae bacterium]|nr:VOC family protein [Rhodospirillaceae bacterium]
MASPVKPIPDGYHTATPYLVVDGAARAIDFYKRAFAATEEVRMAAPGGKVGHAEIRIGNSVLMLADAFPDMGHKGPQTLGGTPVSIMLYVPDADATVAQAVSAGAKVMRPVKDQFYGDRSGTIEDPFGHVWHVSTHVEDVSADEMARRAEAAMKEMGG